MTERRHVATLRDVARAAGVSYQTVSRTINAPSTVLPATRDRVEAAVLETGYYPNAAARRLKIGRSRLLGVVTTDLVGYGPSHTVQAFVEAAEAAGWTVLLVRFPMDHDWQGGDAGRAVSLSALFEYDVQLVGLVGGSVEVAEVIRRIRPHLPILNIGGPIPGYSVVGVDQVRAMDQIVAHLVDQGHREIAHLAGPSGSPDAAERERGWRLALESRGLRIRPPARSDWTASGGRRAVEAWTDRGFTALVCANDQMALGAIRALRLAGRQVPGDISVTGFDDLDEAASYEPPLTTVRQPFDVVGDRALEVARTLTSDSGSVREELVQAHLIVRGSTGPVSSAETARSTDEECTCRSSAGRP